MATISFYLGLLLAVLLVAVLLPALFSQLLVAGFSILHAIINNQFARKTKKKTEIINDKCNIKVKQKGKSITRRARGVGI